MTTARDAILHRIRAAQLPAAPPTRPAPPIRLRPSEDRLARLTTRLRDYGVGVYRVSSAAEIAGTAEARLRAHGAASVIVPPDLPHAWRPRRPHPIEDAGQAAPVLDQIAAVMTGCALAIAETGTLVLDAGAGQGRRALTLMPDLFVCVVHVMQVVDDVPQAITALRPAALAGRPITFVSGPSATADIEFDRVAGVHGPRRLDVILLGG